MVSRVFNGRLFRNNTGALKDQDGRLVRYGLCTGSSDQIGWTPYTVTPEMVGKQIAIFTAIEVKRDEKAYKQWLRSKTKTATQQRRFIQQVQAQGGIAFCTYSEQKAEQQLALLLGHPLPD